MDLWGQRALAAVSGSATLQLERATRVGRLPPAAAARKGFGVWPAGGAAYRNVTSAPGKGRPFVSGRAGPAALCKSGLPQMGLRSCNGAPPAPISITGQSSLIAPGGGGGGGGAASLTGAAAAPEGFLGISRVVGGRGRGWVLGDCWAPGSLMEVSRSGPNGVVVSAGRGHQPAATSQQAPALSLPADADAPAPPAAVRPDVGQWPFAPRQPRRVLIPNSAPLLTVKARKSRHLHAPARYTARYTN
ncbi:PE-PGRS family protein PE_PGRS17-like [Schistocerca americana]|uniref:PE-PGRS family protein PE_PGRS17-like n=1 Tax=Schistocerca americana TaxID=7009 RepID=UPI001F50101C|nr:PE-PGRS family protein PE_PGRS17-like [Schistocerca americana]